MNSFQVTDFSGVNTLTDEGIKNHFKRNMDLWQPIAELIWNGLDARATEIRVVINKNELNGIESITIQDNGIGIDFTRPLDNFRRFNDSLKNKSFSMHGSKGRGRLAFHKICSTAAWHTRFKGQDAIIKIEKESLSGIFGKTIPAEQQHPALLNSAQGTVVELYNFFASAPSDEDLAHQLSLELGHHLVLNPDKSIYLNHTKVVPPEHSVSSTVVFQDSETFNIKLIRWHKKPSSEKSHTYLLTSTGQVVHYLLSSLNNKPDYYTSLFVSSSWLDDFGEDSLITPDPSTITNSNIWKGATRKITTFAQEHYGDFLRSLADKQIDLYVSEGDFPDYSQFEPSYSKWRESHTKSIIRSIIIADPKLLKTSSKRQRKIIIRLLDKISVSNENGAILDVLESVLELGPSDMNLFAAQLKRSRLNNIIQTIETLQQRDLVVQRIAEIMRSHYKETLETPDLQDIIESNTWLFGNQYETIGAEEHTFTKIASNLRDKVKDINDIETEDIDDDATIEGAARQVDLFMVRKSKQLDSNGKPYFKCVIVEIKRPSIALNNKHLQQLEDYAAILDRHPDFNGQNTLYEMILLGRKISDRDFQIKSRLNDLADKNDPGLIGTGKVKRYVKTWATIIEEFNLSTDYLLDTLQTQRDSLENESKESLIKAAQQVSA